ncbi:hypothetical protein ACNOYE_23785 [Nannocystaceae bacterium ST9]
MRSSLRLLALVPLALLLVEGAGPLPQAAAEDSLAGSLSERAYSIEVVPGPETTTLEVTRTFFNPTFDPQQLGLRIDMPCEGILDRLELRGPDDAQGRPTWVSGKLGDPTRASERFDEVRFGEPGDAIEADTIAVLARSSACSAELDLFPVPPLRERSVRYRIQVPSQYGEGRYQTALPIFQLEFKGASLHVGDPSLAGFELAIDGKPAGDDRQLSGRSPHTLTLTPIDDRHARVSLAAIDLHELDASREPMSLVAAELDVPLAIVDLPPVRRVVVVVDGSYSFSDRASSQALAAAYLDALALAQPDARVEILHFDREVRPVFGEFVEPTQARARMLEPVVGRNGSEPGLALDHARALLSEARAEGEVGVDWLLLVSDLELRDGFPLAEQLDAAEASEVRMHVIRPDSGYSLVPMPLDHPWTSIAHAAGGAHYGFTMSESQLARDGAELLAPNRIRDLRVTHADARGRTTDALLTSELATGESIEWVERLAAPAIERVGFEASTWAGPLTWSAKPSRSAQQRWAGLLTTGRNPWIELDDAEASALAELAKVASPWTSLVAEARFEGRSIASELWGSGGFMSGSHGFSTRCGGVGRAHAGRWPDLSTFATTLEQVIGECGVVEPGSLMLEILDREIVVVEADQTCVREATWALDLRSWPSFGHPIVQVAYDPSGVRQFQMTSLVNDTPATFE